MKKNITIIAFLIGLFYASPALSQGLALNTTNATADAGSILDVSATNKGVLIPRIDYLNRPTTSVTTGMLIYVTANGPQGNNAFYYYNGTSWLHYYSDNDLQQLSLSNDTLSISNGSSVDASDVFPIAGYTKCGNNYFNLQTNNAHCGVCSTACPVGQTCSGGTCH